MWFDVNLNLILRSWQLCSFTTKINTLITYGDKLPSDPTVEYISINKITFGTLKKENAVEDGGSWQEFVLLGCV